MNAGSNFSGVSAGVGGSLPFNGADDGLSVDGGTGKVVLGDDGDMSSQLTDDRSMWLNGHTIAISNGSANQAVLIQSFGGYALLGSINQAGNLVGTAYYVFSGINEEPTSDTFFQLDNDNADSLAWAIFGSANGSHGLLQYNAGGHLRLSANPATFIAFNVKGITDGGDSLRVYAPNGNVVIDPTGVFTGNDTGQALQVTGKAKITVLDNPSVNLIYDVGQDSVTGILTNRGQAGSIVFNGDGVTTTFNVAYAGLGLTPAQVFLQATNAAAAVPCWVVGKGVNTFNVQFAVAPGVGVNPAFDWQVKN